MRGTFQRLECSGPWNIPRSGNRGFTLLELLVVMLIIAVLTGIGAAGYSMARTAAKESQAKADIELIRNALEEYRVEYGAYPRSQDGSISSIFSELEDYASIEPLDPWGRPYGYVSTNRFQYQIWSAGLDESDAADDINPQKVGY